MRLFVLILGFVLFPQAHTLTCLACHSDSDTCNESQCLHETYLCGAGRLVIYNETLKIGDHLNKACLPPEDCTNISMTIGVLNIAVTAQCCDSDLCNNNYVPEEPLKSKPNGRKCHCEGMDFCREPTVDCEGDQDVCFEASVNFTGKDEVSKGCASRGICLLQHVSTFKIVSCCEGNLCNGAAGASANLLLLTPALLLLFLQLSHM